MSLGNDLVVQKETSIFRFERFIEKYPEREEGAEIRFQLADIYFQQAEREFTDANILFEEQYLDNPDLENDIRLNLEKPFALYEDIVERFPGSSVVDGALYMMAWCQNDPRSDLFDAETSLANFQRIVAEYPDSRFAAQANYFVGLYYFDKNETETAPLGICPCGPRIRHRLSITLQNRESP